MEYPLTSEDGVVDFHIQVLILVLMEYPLTIDVISQPVKAGRLNPCSNGIPSDTMIQRALTFCCFKADQPMRF